MPQVGTMGLFRGEHLLIILIIVLLVFGPSKLPSIGAGLGKSIRDFKRAMSDGGEPPAQQGVASTEKPAEAQGPATTSPGK